VTHLLRAVRFRAALLSVLFAIAFCPCRSQTRDVVCNGGEGSFSATFPTGVDVSVGAVKKGPLSQRLCGAKLGWRNTILPIADDAWQVDIDLLGADLGLKTPVVAFQIKQSDLDVSMTYKIYSLQKPSRLLRTIKGGDFFRAVDTDLKGSIEIWTGDASVSGFEGLSLADLDFAPTVVLRFEKQRLIDVSSEFQSHYDLQIAQLKALLGPGQLDEFRKSDGKLSTANISPLATERMHSLVVTKIKVLEIVWAYLYSGREQIAWDALAAMWPSADLDRIRSSLSGFRSRGIDSETDGVSPGGMPHRKKSVFVYETRNEKPADDNDGSSRPPTLKLDSIPEPILLRTAPPSDNRQVLPTAEKFVDLVIDAAGKVHSAKMDSDTEKGLKDSSFEWKFIPAFRGGQPVASRMSLAVTPYR
jgi:hypothetical protein